jgi:hypothetical protein
MFILYITSRYSHFNILFSKACQRQYELLFGQAVSGEKIFKKSANQKQELPVVAMFGNGSYWSISKKPSPLKLLSHMNRNLVGSIYMYGRSCIKFPQSRMKGERHRLSPLSL